MACVPYSHFSPSSPFPAPLMDERKALVYTIRDREGKKISLLIRSEAKFMQGTTHALYYTMKAVGNNSSVPRNRDTHCSKKIK